MATHPTQPDATLPVPPEAPEEPKPAQERQCLPGEPPDAPVPDHGMAKPTKEQLDYWERMLKNQGLSMDKGDGQRVSKKDRRRRVVYVGDGDDLALVDSMGNNKIAGGGRRVRPKGTPPDDFEGADNDD